MSNEFDFRCFAVVQPREQLYRGIDMRCERMLLDGLLQEVMSLVLAGKLDPTHPAAKHIGYHESLEFLATKPLPTFKDILALLTTLQNNTRCVASPRIDARKPTGDGDDCSLGRSCTCATEPMHADNSRGCALPTISTSTGLTTHSSRSYASSWWRCWSSRSTSTSITPIDPNTRCKHSNTPIRSMPYVVS